MTSYNPENERIKRDYFRYLREAKRRNEASVDGAAKALSRFEESTGRRAFSKFHREQAVAFKRKLDEQTSARTGERLSRATVHSTLSALRAFFIWLADQPGYKRKISYTDADYFNLADNDVRIAKAVREKTPPTLEQVHHILAVMPANTVLERRERAVVAFALLTGARDAALASFKLKHVHLDQGRVDQDAREVRTKFAKTFTTWFFPVGGEALSIFAAWVDELKTDHLWGAGDPLFPSTLMTTRPTGGFFAAGLARKPWSTAEPIRRVFRLSCARAGLPYFKPHLIRDTLAQLGEQTCRTPEEFKAWSQNLGHENVLTTFTSYGAVASHRQAALIRELGDRREGVQPLTAEAIRTIVETALARATV